MEEEEEEEDIMTIFSQLVTQLDDLCPLYWDLCIDHLYHLCSHIQRTQKYSAVMYKFFSVRKIVMLLWTRCGSWMVIVFLRFKGYHITVKKTGWQVMMAWILLISPA